MAHVFYYGMHPVSWFILFASLAVTVMEWKFLITQYIHLSKQPKVEDCNA